MKRQADKKPEEVDSPLYHHLIKVSILLAVLSLVALGISSYRKPDADNKPAPFSCSSLPLPEGGR